MKRTPHWENQERDYNGRFVRKNNAAKRRPTRRVDYNTNAVITLIIVIVVYAIAKGFGA